MQMEGQNVPATVQDLKKWMEIGEQLIKQHARGFDIQSVFFVEKTASFIEDICKNVEDILHSMELVNAVNIEVKIPQSYVSEDNTFLETWLHFIYDQEDNALEDKFSEEWRTAKAKHEELLQQLSLITDNDIVVDCKNRISEDSENIVYQGCWQQHMIAVHKCKTISKKEPSSEKFTNASANAALIVCKHSPCIGDALAISDSGTLVMEWGSTDLMGWCEQHGDCHLKIKALQQAASALEHLHSEPTPVMHREITPRSFLVFGNDEDDSIHIKLWGHRYLAVQTADIKRMLMQSSETTVYSAPELCNGGPDTLQSDVFSFGVVMCEVAAQRAPYGGERVPKEIVLMMKNSQLPPFPVPDVFPEDFEKLILECISVVPSRRPSIKKVKERLEMILRK